MSDPILYFVTPAWKRYELSGVCFDQRQAVIERLARDGVEAHCVVVADDENLDLARERGFATVERNNTWLGRKFNDGMEYAGKHGADYIVPIGSDSWIDPDYFLPLAEAGFTRTSPNYCVVEPTRLAELRVMRASQGAGPYVFPRKALAIRDFRPARDEIRSSVDASTLRGLVLRWERRDMHPYQYVGFRGTPHITSYERLRRRWGVAEQTEPWEILALRYPADLVERARHALMPQ